jgi:tRNA (guanine-N7-)-methyltransferase
MLSRLKKLELTNVRLVQRPAQELFADLPPGRVNEIRIFFPDPWPKKRHHKRRLIQPEFLQQMHQALAPDGRVRLATDWAEYGEWIVEHFAAFAGFEVELDVIRDAFAAAETADQNVRDTTKFEARGERLGHRIRDLIFHKI